MQVTFNVRSHGHISGPSSSTPALPQRQGLSSELSAIERGMA